MATVTEEYDNGDKYVGQFINGQRNGKGMYTYADGTCLSYDGEWKDNNKHGYGKMKWKDGDTYSGEWRNGAKNGKGLFTWNGGDKYDGQYKDDLKNGNGVYTYANHGTLLCYDGEWKDNKKHGYGVMKYRDGDTYCGYWENDQRNGKGVYTWQNGDKYTGQYKNGAKNGKGVYTYANHDTYLCYDGEWRDNKKHGYGVMKYKDGSSYSGLWENDEELDENVDDSKEDDKMNDVQKKNKISKDDDFKEKPKFITMVKKSRTFEEECQSLNVSIPIGKIANALVASVGAYASGGALAPLLAHQLKDAVLNAGWSSSKTKEDIVEHFFNEDTYIFFEMKRNVKKTKKSFGFIGKEKSEITAKTLYFFVQAGNNAAKMELEQLQRQQSNDAFQYIKNMKGWVQ